MPLRLIPWQKFYTAGTGIEIDDDKVISLKLRDENNLIFVNDNNEIYVDLQLPDEIEPTDAFPVWVTTWRVLVADGRDKTGTIICAKTTSWDEIKVLYADDGTLRLDNGTGTFKQVYFKADVDLLISTLTTYINTELAKKQNWVTSDTAPSNPSEWDLWYDTTTNEMKVYDGSQRNVAGGATYTAGKWIAILNGTDYSAMRWPCDEWYHVPNETELTALITALTTLWLTLVDTTAQTYLLMPLAWMRARNDGSVSAQWTEWYYRSCDSASLNRAKRLQIDSYDIAVGWTPISIWASIRPFKDEAVIPDSWRTTLYAGTWDAGIFHNSTDGIISISADGTTWMTIADKNLWATTVYNSGDTESQANCGNYYQWWNNYGFTWTWAVTTSSTQVDASSYWPSEYSSSTFITDSPRDYPRNLDLWWGVTGTTQNNNAITNLWVLVSDQANNIFTPWMKIWWGTQTDYQSLTPDSNTAYLLLADQPTPPSPWRQPWVNTLVYLPLNWDALDQSGNSRDGTLPSSYSWDTLPNWNQCFAITWWRWDFSSYCITWTYSNTALWSWDRTISIRMKINSWLNNHEFVSTFIWSPSWWTSWEWFGWRHMSNSSNLLWIIRYMDDPNTTSFTYDTNWHNYVLTYSNTNKWKVYVDGVQIAMTNNPSVSFDTLWTNYAVGIWRNNDYDKSLDLSNFIIEDKERTAQDISDYYNATKWDYWIS